MLAINDIFEGESTQRTRVVAIGIRINGELWHPSAAHAASSSECRHCAFVFSLIAGKHAPIEVDWQELLGRVESGDITRSSAAIVLASEQDVSAARRAQGQKRWQLIKGLIEDSRMRIFEKDGRKALVDAHAAATETSPNTVWRALRDFWRGGSTDALIPGIFGNLERAKTEARASAIPALVLVSAGCRRTPSGTFGMVSKGRKTDPLNPIYREPYPFVGEERDRVISRALELYDPKNKTNRKLYRDIIKEFYLSTDENLVARPKPLGSRPSPRQLSWAVLGRLKLSEKLLIKSSDADFENNHKAKTSTVKDVVPSVGHTFEIDSTIVDVLIVSKFSRTKVIHKATLYLIVDSFSRLIVGFHLTLDKPSLDNAIEAILTIAEDKAELCRRWGALYRPSAWTQAGLYPTKFLCDRGSDFTAGGLIMVIKPLGAALVQAPARLSSRKGMVELSFRLVNVALRGDVPGWVSPIESEKRQADDMRPTARYTLHDLGGQILDEIGAHNIKIQSDYARDVEDVLADAPASPIEIWHRDYARSAGHMRSVPYEALRWKLQSSAMAVVTQNGFSINDCYYGERNGQFSEWFVRGGQGRFKILAFFDRRSVNRIWVRDSKNPTTVPVPVDINSHSIRFKDLSVGEVEEIKRLEKTQSYLAEEHNFGIDMDSEHLAEQRRAAADKAYAAAQEAVGKDRSHVDTDGELRDREAREGRNKRASRPAAGSVDEVTDAVIVSRPARSPKANSKKLSTVIVEELTIEQLERDLLNMGGNQ